MNGPTSPGNVAALRDVLAGIVGDAHVLTKPEDVIAYGFDGTFFANTPPLVVLPGLDGRGGRDPSLRQRERIAMTPRAMGSGLSGGSVPLAGSIVLGVARLNRILAIDEIDRVAVVQAGVITADLQAAVEARGLFYPPDPSSLKQSAIGGNVRRTPAGRAV